MILPISGGRKFAATQPAQFMTTVQEAMVALSRVSASK